MGFKVPYCPWAFVISGLMQISPSSFLITCNNDSFVMKSKLMKILISFSHTVMNLIIQLSVCLSNKILMFLTYMGKHLEVGQASERS
jgi:hypothetical protein